MSSPSVTLTETTSVIEHENQTSVPSRTASTYRGRVFTDDADCMKLHVKLNVYHPTFKEYGTSHNGGIAPQKNDFNLRLIGVGEGTFFSFSSNEGVFTHPLEIRKNTETEKVWHQKPSLYFKKADLL